MVCGVTAGVRALLQVHRVSQTELCSFVLLVVGQYLLLHCFLVCLEETVMVLSFRIPPCQLLRQRFCHYQFEGTYEHMYVHTLNRFPRHHQEPRLLGITMQICWLYLR